ncbi:MAG: serine hydrolase [Acidimicrobiia bacterium]|nr:class A beta-lactamase-related serine hydrolase [bacterium]MDE0674512.1 class A beta-lactamase-related serine hydrolase [bacterium]MXX00481.1 serine hydrolase [Acidimicrobiia bacterium]MYB79776.1 serine hydrolase [Acidimicrobiia bacterium]
MSYRSLWERLEKRSRQRVEDFEGVAAVSVLDLERGDGFSIRGDEVFPTASSIKIHILTQLLARAERGEIDLTDRVRITHEMYGRGSGVIHYMESEPELSVLDIAILMIIVSDNTSTNMCIDWAGMEATNALLDDMGLTETRLRRKMMDSQAIDRGEENVSTPNELVAMMEMLYRGKPSPGVADQVLRILGKPKSTPLNRALPSNLAVANKSGGMERVRCDVGIVFLPERPYAITVMTKFGLRDSTAGEALIMNVARDVHQTMAALAGTNDYGLGVLTFTSY